MDFNEYQKLAATTAVYPKELAIPYLGLGVADEAGEVAGKIKKSLRGDKPLDVELLKKEMGDVLWYLAGLCTELGVDFNEVAEGNIDKLFDRKERGVLKGDGDTR